MDVITFVVGYPLSWVMLLVISSVFLFVCSYKGWSLFVGVISLVMAVGITPIGSELALDSISEVFINNEMKCDPLDLPRSIIILPGGLTGIGPEVHMTRWTASRVEWINEYSNLQDITEIIIPGGFKYMDKMEGTYIKSQLKEKILESISIQIGKGSYSTFSNFIEITEFIKNKKYGLVTSNWHAYRAIKVAAKQGKKLCLFSDISNNESLKLKEYPWAFKAVLREYIAIAWYKLKGRI